jgi:hypothetical protein
VPLLEYLLTAGWNGYFTSLKYLPDAAGGNNDISKLLDQGEITQMRRSVQLEIGTTEADTITMTMGWIEIAYIVESKDIHTNNCGNG